MKKQLLSIAIIASFALTPSYVFAASNYTMQTPTMQYNTNGYNQTQYPLPVNSYQSQGYNSNYNKC